jgi:hypothetical protein
MSVFDWLCPQEEVGDLKLLKRRTSAPAVLPVQEQGDENRTVGRRALLTRGGVVAAGVVGAGVAGAAVAGSANAAAGDPVLQGAVNDVGTDQPATVIQATSNAQATPTLVLTNLGMTAAGEASPPLRLTPAALDLSLPSDTTGGDLIATNNDGNLYFTHGVGGAGAFRAAVHTDANSNSFAPLAVPHRILDTRNSSGRAQVIDPSGKFDSSGRLLAGKTIHINLTTLVSFADAVTANLTVINPAANGYLTLWSGAGGRPNASSISFAKGAAPSNLTVSAVGEFMFNNVAHPDTIGIFATATTHVILDVAGFHVRFFGQVLVPLASVSPTRIQAARAAIAKSPS